MFYFCHSKSFSNIWKYIFNSISRYCSENISLLTYTRSKRVIRQINLFFLTSWKMATFLLEMFVIFNMITDLFLVEKWGILERAKRNVCFRIVFVLASFSLENEEHLGRVPTSHFLQNVLIETSNICFKSF